MRLHSSVWAMVCGAAVLAVPSCAATPETEVAKPAETISIPAAGAIGSQLRMVGPFTHENLTVYLLLDSSADDSREFLTLDAGLKQGTVVVAEQGGGRAAQVD